MPLLVHMFPFTRRVRTKGTQEDNLKRFMQMLRQPVKIETPLGLIVFQLLALVVVSVLFGLSLHSFLFH